MGTQTFDLMCIAMGFTCVAALSFHFSTRWKKFVRTFVPKEELIGVVREFRKPEAQRGMRLIAGLQFLMALIIWCAFVISFISEHL